MVNLNLREDYGFGSLTYGDVNEPHAIVALFRTRVPARVIEAIMPTRDSARGLAARWNTRELEWNGPIMRYEVIPERVAREVLA